MWAVVIEIDVLGRHQIAGVAQVIKQVFVQIFIAHAPVEAFYEPVLHQLAHRCRWTP